MKNDSSPIILCEREKKGAVSSFHCVYCCSLKFAASKGTNCQCMLYSTTSTYRSQHSREKTACCRSCISVYNATFKRQSFWTIHLLFFGLRSWLLSLLCLPRCPASYGSAFPSDVAALSCDHIAGSDKDVREEALRRRKPHSLGAGQNLHTV
jgi:hypothetical protein